jgi:hypothetical protein
MINKDHEASVLQRNGPRVSSHLSADYLSPLLENTLYGSGGSINSNATEKLAKRSP